MLQIIETIEENEEMENAEEHREGSGGKKNGSAQTARESAHDRRFVSPVSGAGWAGR